MAKQKRGLSGDVSANPTGGASGAGADSRETMKFWVSHRQGPFLFHDNTGPCEPQSIDNVGYLNDAGSAIDQGFEACSRCLSS